MFQIYYWPLPLPHPSLFFTGNKLLKNSPYVLTCLIAPFFNIPFTSVSISFCCSRFFPTGKKSLIEKVSFEKVLHNHLLNLGYSDPWLISSKPLRNVLVFLLLEHLELCLRRTTFFSVGEHFLIQILNIFLELNSCWRRFCLKNIYLPCLCWLVWVCWRNLLYHYLIFRNSILRPWWEKLFAPHSVLVVWGARRKGLFRICEDFTCFFLWFDCVRNVIPKFLPEQFLVMFL